MIDIPSDFTEFLYWIKEKTESYWSVPPSNSPQDITCEEWLYGAKWIGLTEEQIDLVEIKYNVKFIPEHRAFLRVLHAIDRKERIEHEWLRVAITDEEIDLYENKHAIKFTPEYRTVLKTLDRIDQNDSFAEISDRAVVEIEIEEGRYFYNWLTDETIIKECLEWPFKTILQDVLDTTWLKSWGDKPDSTEDKEVIFTKWYQDAPPLLPLTAHTFLVSAPNLEYKPLLSVVGSDVIIAGWSLKAYLISHFAPALGLYEMIYNEEDKLFYPEFKKGVLTTLEEYFQFKLIHPLPYWGEMILFSGWQFHQVDAEEKTVN